MTAAEEPSQPSNLTGNTAHCGPVHGGAPTKTSPPFPNNFCLFPIWVATCSNDLSPTCSIAILSRGAYPADAAPPTAERSDDRVYFDAYSEAISAVVDKVDPAVVRVDTREKSGNTGRGDEGASL